MRLETAMDAAARISELIKDWSHMLKKKGARSALPVIGLEIARLPYRHLRFFIIARALDVPLPDIKPKIALAIRPFLQADLEFVREIDRPSEARQCDLRLKSGYQGFAALFQDQLAGYAWGCTEINPQAEKVLLDLKPGDVLCNDAFTNPAFRGQGVQTALALARFRFFCDQGYRRAICYIETKNAPSLTVWQRKLGGRIMGSLDFLRIGPWHHFRCDWIAESENNRI